MTKPQLYSMKWNNYQNHVSGTFVQLLQSETMVDLTLCAEGVQIKCHRIVISACSPYFQDILSNTTCTHPVVVLSGIASDDLRSIIEFVYHGELSVKAERFASVLKAAETLQICGLMEVQSHLPILQKEAAKNEEIEKPPTPEEVEVETEDTNMMQNFEMIVCDQEVEVSTGEDQDQLEFQYENSMNSCKEELSGISESDANLEIASPLMVEKIKKRKKRRESTRKEYSEKQLTAALHDLVAGKSLVKTALDHSIPRSTLYSRAKSFGLAPIISRQEYSFEKMTEAVKAVSAGASLQQAADSYGIPKTVLWRRVQKEVGMYALSRRARLKQKYSPDVREAAVRALENGENITKVASEYQIPKTTLFRDKSKLVEAGRLPFHFLNKRTANREGQIRLSQAVAACREGKMSQAAASTTFEVPKTTIWRRLRKLNALEEKQNSKDIYKNNDGVISHEVVVDIKDEDEIKEEFNLSEVVTYIDDTDYSETSLIILAPGEEGDITLQENGEIVESIVKEGDDDDDDDVLAVETIVVNPEDEGMIT